MYARSAYNNNKIEELDLYIMYIKGKELVLLMYAKSLSTDYVIDSRSALYNTYWLG